MKTKKLKRRIYSKLMILEAMLVVVMYFLVPVLANYPPYSENIAFQKEILGVLTHINQYLSFGIFATFLVLIAIKYLFRDIFKFIELDKHKKISYEKIQKIRSQCHNMPIKLMFFQLTMQVFILLNVFALVEMSTALKVKFTLIYLSFFVAAWVLSVVLVKSDLNKIVEMTYEKENKYTMPKKTGYFYKTLLYNLIPFFLVIVICLTLFGYGIATNKVGDGIYAYYKQELKDEDFENKTIEELEVELKLVKKDSESDFYFIANNDIQVLEKNNVNNKISDFFIKYADKFFDKHNGRMYETFGVEAGGYAQRVKLNSGETVYVGFKYNTSDLNLLVPFILSTSIATGIYFLILIVWSRNISKNIEVVAEELGKVAEESDIDSYRVLPIVSRDEVGRLTDSYNKIQLLTIDHIKQIEANRGRIVEQERLVSLGQMIGGIAHNLKTPILSIAGAAEGIRYLAEEMEESLVTSTVTTEDKKEIIREQEEWVEKIKVHLEYMNDIITAVKGQATTFTTQREEKFTVQDLFKNVEILTSHEFKNALTKIEVINNVPNSIYIQGDFNSLLQITNNIVINAIQAYEGKPENKVELVANIGPESKNLVISVRDFGKGMSESVQEKLFKQMVTTKGKYGTGLGLYMSYSTIKGKFRGDIKFNSEEGKGTTFHIILPKYESNQERAGEDSYISEQRQISYEPSEEEQVENPKREDIYTKNASTLDDNTGENEENINTEEQTKL